MKKLLALIALTLPLNMYAGEENQLVARDSNGLIIEVKEKYGGTIIDTCTAVIFHQGNFVVIHREGVSAWFPSAFHSVRVLERLPHTNILALNKKEFLSDVKQEIVKTKQKFN